ncbi:MAG: DUF5683 domain-containing protein [Syntrophothermus sp.]
MKKVIFVFMIIICPALWGQVLQEKAVKLTGNLKEDSRLVLAGYDTANPDDEAYTEGKKSVFLAGLMSAVIPGAGEFYTKHYWKAALFVAIEAAAIGVSVHYNKKGDDATTEFKNYADTHWSVVRYAEWLNKYKTELGAGSVPSIIINGNENLKPWERVDWDQIHAVEEQIRTFSHRLENHGEQQYYELIGKYKQYNHGWDQSDPNTSEYFTNVPQQMYDFSEMFLKPDKTYYKYANQAIAVLLLNHLASTIDAVLSAHFHNKDLKMGVKLQQSGLKGTVEYFPELRMSMRF